VTWSAAYLDAEARALALRLDRLAPLALSEPMLPVAAPSPRGLLAIERTLARRRQRLRAHIERFRCWLAGPGAHATAAQQQRQYVPLRLAFTVALTQFDLFSDVITQRSERGHGEWLGGLDAAALDALALRGGELEPPPLLCYLDGGSGGAIRRARTRLPGGGTNPVAIIRIPRERMVGSGIASSLAHEVGHQGAELLGLMASLRPVFVALLAKRGAELAAWRFWRRWLSEILADLWAVARVGVASTLGLMGIVSLPAPFQFRLRLDDPHPAPWLRVQLSCALGDALYPHSQWAELARRWRALYPPPERQPGLRALLDNLCATMPALAGLLVDHRPPALAGRTLAEALTSAELHPTRLAAELRRLGPRAAAWRELGPCRVFALLGQGRADGAISPALEARLLAELLGHWALRRAFPRAEPRSSSHSTMAATA
jgi:hypothetical protein